MTYLIISALGILYLFGVLCPFQHCTVHITTGSWKGRGTYSSSEYCTVNCQLTASNYQLSHLRPCQELNPGLRGWRRECHHSATVAPALGIQFRLYCNDFFKWCVCLFAFKKILGCVILFL